MAEAAEPVRAGPVNEAGPVGGAEAVGGADAVGGAERLRRWRLLLGADAAGGLGGGELGAGDGAVDAALAALV